MFIYYVDTVNTVWNIIDLMVLMSRQSIQSNYNVNSNTKSSSFILEQNSNWVFN